MSSINRYQGVDPVLTNVSIGYQNSAYIAELLYPALPVAKQSGKHFIYDKGKFRNNDNLRGTGAASKEVTLNLTTGVPYFCEDHALKQFVTDEDMDGAVAPMDPMVDATENVTEMHMVAREVELAASLTSTSVLTQYTTLSGTSQWSDYSNSDPFSVIETGKQIIHSAIHVDPNTLVLGKQVWDKLKHHPAFLERVKYSQKGVISEDLLATLVGVDRVIIAAAGKNAAVEGQTDSMSYIWGKNAILAYINPRVGQKTITLGRTYQWKSRKVERLRGTNEEDRKGTYVRVGDHYYDQQLVSLSAGYLVTAAVA
jgi:hypothetical protein